MDTSFPYPSGSTFEADSIPKIFDVVWSQMSEQILKTSLLKDPNWKWTIEDINLYLASQLVMGLTPEPSIRDYFQHDPNGIFGSTWLQQTFTEPKWTNINTTIHIEPNPLMQQLRTNFQKSWNLCQILIVDEMIRTFTGRWKWIQYVKGKPHDTGLKMFAVTDDSFYVHDFWLYQGEEDRPSDPTNIVLNFVDTALQEHYKPHIVVTDSYYSSLKLAEALHSRKIGCLLSCRSDRPSHLFTNTLHHSIEKKGESAAICNRNFYAMTYYDKTKVNLISNVINLNKWITCNSRSLPLGICWYRKWLGGLDHFDRWLNLYLTPHRNIKWTQALLSTLLKIAVNDTHTIAIYMDFETTFKDTTIEIINHLSGTHSVRQRETQTKQSTGEHFPEQSKSQDCKHCLESEIRSKTTFKCDTCEVPLHPKCFKPFHKK
jgi:hypothetical protein